MKIVFFVFLAFFQSFWEIAVAQDVQGYGASQWGMSTEEVLATDPSRILKLDPPGQFADALALLTIPSLTIGVMQFRVLYLFDKNNGLKQVNVAGKEESNVGINRRHFSELEQQLTAKYGQPFFKNDGAKVSWRLGPTSVDLTHFLIPGIATQVIITYKLTAATGEASKDL